MDRADEMPEQAGSEPGATAASDAHPGQITSKLAHGWAGIPVPAPTQVQTPTPAAGLHFTYWWQIEALLNFERQVAVCEYSFVVEANLELRNDE